MHVDRLKGWEAFSKKELEQSPNYMALYRQSQEFMSKNFQALDQSKRCACSPCVNVKSCNCGDRALEGQCRLESPRHCVDPSTGEVQRKAKLPNGRQDPATQDIYCRNDFNCRDVNFPKCHDNRNYIIYQCTKYILEYTPNPPDTAKCRGRVSTNTECNSHDDCGAEGVCQGGDDFQCPKPLETDDTSPVSMCWLCPEIKLGGLVNPRNAKSWWAVLDRPADPKVGGFNLCRSCFAPFGQAVCTEMPSNQVTLFGLNTTVS